MKSKLVSILLDYYTNKSTDLRTNGKRAVFFEYGRLSRVFNSGNGILSFACIKDGVLVINDYLDYLCKDLKLSDYQISLLSNYACTLHP